jgi:small subunit ribosomal protein S4
MARIEIDAKCKLCRREGDKLFLKGARCNSTKCAYARRPFPPGVHGPKKASRITDYGKQLREKQKAKRLYGISETQFSNYFQKALKLKGDSGINLVRLLEMRLDNVLYRAGLGKTRSQSRQLVSHSHMSVNGRKVNIPSYQVKPGDIIALQERKTNKQPWKDISENLKNVETPSWLVLDASVKSVKISGMPTAEELKQTFDPKLIIEYYSR